MNRKEKEKNRQKQAAYRKRLAENGYRIVSVKTKSEDVEAVKALVNAYGTADRKNLIEAAKLCRSLSKGLRKGDEPHPQRDLLALVADILDTIR